MNALRQYLYNILLDLDEDANVFLIGFLVVVLKIIGIKNIVPAAGNAHFTVSQTCAEMRQAGNPIGCKACAILTAIFKPFNLTVKNYDHCTSAMQGMPEDIDAG